MRITLEPTPEMFDAPINGVKVPTRVWKGRTDSGLEIEAYILSIVPENETDAELLRIECEQAGLHRSRDVFTVDIDES